MKFKIKFKNQEGVALIMTLLLVSSILSVVFALSLIFVPKVRIAADIKNSSAAFYAAESAVEWCLYANRIDSSATMPVMSNGAAYANGNNNNAPFVQADCLALPVKATGTYRGVSRVLQVNLN